MKLRPAVVLDTNVALDLFLFADARVGRLASALAEGEVDAFCDAPCLAELRRVLEYPVFSLEAIAADKILQRYLARVTFLDVPLAESFSNLPKCSDPDDQKFLELTWRCGADLLTRDKALLCMHRRFAKLGGGRICEPEKMDFTGIGNALQTHRTMSGAPDLGHNFISAPQA
jgi:putative PIN family toxin of toxin-antitoxin system